MSWRLPTTVEVRGTVYDVRTDYRAILDICTALTDIELMEQERIYVALDIFYPAFDTMPPEHLQEAIRECYKFINLGKLESEDKKSPRLIDWETDFVHIAGPVSRIAGTEIRAVEYMHWWTFISLYNEIGDCYFAQIVRIRDKKAKGRPLDKSDREFYRNNRDVIDLDPRYTQEEQDLFDMWTGGGT